jgi:hypothetical protein
MKRLNKKLLDDLLEDSSPLEFRVAVMEKTLHSARQRKRLRHFSAALIAAALIGIFVFTFREMRERAVSSNQIRPLTLAAASHPSLNRPQVVATKPDSTLVVVQTRESYRPKEISDKELVALLSNEPVVLVRYASDHAELISLNQNN